jgi:DNA-binding response OmpR family regulator
MTERPRILIVDHSLNSLSSLYIGLLMEDYNVEASNDAGEIMPRIKRFNPNLVILNKDLPGIDFETICRDLKLRQLPLILVLDKPQAECVQIDGCCISEVIVKPVQVKKLNKLIEELVVQD